MTARRIGFVLGLVAFTATLLTAPPAGMPREAWLVAGLVVWMAAWWMTEAVPLTVTALLPFVVLPFSGVMDAKETASAYYAPILFLILGGAFIALAIERTGLHRRLSLAILATVGSGTGIPRAPARIGFALIFTVSLLSLAIFNVSTSLIVLALASAILGGLVLSGPEKLLFAFMVSAAVLSMLISNTSTALIMMPMALAVLAGGGLHGPASSTGTVGEQDIHRSGLAGALPMGIAFAASIGGLGTIVGSPTNGIAVALLDSMIGLQISFAEWTLYGLPIVIVGVPAAAVIIAKVQKVGDHPFDVEAAREAIDTHAAWTRPEKRLVPVIAVTFALWMTAPLLKAYMPDGALTDGTIAVVAGILLFVIPDGTGRPLLIWAEADRAPWGVILMFGGGLALAAGMGASGLAEWLGNALLPLSAVPLIVAALALVAMVVLITEFASNVATASAIIPVVASLTVAMGVDPVLLAMPAALAASWGFMLPAGTGPNAIAWSTGRIALPRMVGAGLLLDLIGVVLIVALVWAVASIAA